MMVETKKKRVLITGCSSGFGLLTAVGAAKVGLVLAVEVHAADWQDQDGACWVLEKLKEKFRLKD